MQLMDVEQPREDIVLIDTWWNVNAFHLLY